MKFRLSINTLLIAWNEGIRGQATGIGRTRTCLHRSVAFDTVEMHGSENMNLESPGGEMKWAQDQLERWFVNFRQNCSVWTAGFDPGRRTLHSNVIFMRKNKVFSQSLNLCRHCSVFWPMFFLSLCVVLIFDLPEGKKTKVFFFAIELFSRSDLFLQIKYHK